MSLQDMFEKISDSVEISPFTVFWSMKGVGWGQYNFYMDENNIVHIQNECMSRESIKKVLCMMVDEAVLDDDDLRPKPQPSDNISANEGC